MPEIVFDYPSDGVVELVMPDGFTFDVSKERLRVTETHEFFDYLGLIVVEIGIVQQLSDDEPYVGSPRILVPINMFSICGPVVVVAFETLVGERITNVLRTRLEGTWTRGRHIDVSDDELDAIQRQVESLALVR